MTDSQYENRILGAENGVRPDETRRFDSLKTFFSGLLDARLLTLRGAASILTHRLGMRTPVPFTGPWGDRRVGAVP